MNQDFFNYYSKLRVCGEFNFVVILESDVDNVDDLLNDISSKLMFPGYFGENWNALYDCLCDFTWVENYSIAIIHKELPRINAQDLIIYLTVLRDASLKWREWKEHDFKIFFPEELRPRINSLI